MSHKREVIEEPLNDTVSNEEIENRSYVNPRTFSDAVSGSDSDSPLPSPSLYTIRPIFPNPEQVKPPRKAKKKNSSRDDVGGGGGGGEGECGGEIDDAKKKKIKKKKISVDDGGGEGDVDGGGGGGEGGGDTENAKKKKKRKMNSSIDGGGGDGHADGSGGGGGEGGGDNKNVKKKKTKEKSSSVDGGGDEGDVDGNGSGGCHSKEKNKKPKLDAKTENNENSGGAAADGGLIGGVTLALFASKGHEFSRKKKQKRVSKDSSIARKEIPLSVEGSIAMKSEDEDDFEESEEVAELDKWWKKYPCLRESFEMERHLNDRAKGLLREKFREVGETKLNELEKRWRDVRSSELKLFMERSELVNEQVKLVIDAIKSEDLKHSQLQILSE